MAMKDYVKEILEILMKLNVIQRKINFLTI